MSLKTLATLFVQKLAPQNALSAENTIISLLFKNWLVCVCVCVQPQRFQVSCSFSLLSFFIRFYAFILPYTNTFSSTLFKNKSSL